MSFLKSLFGGKAAAKSAAEPVVHNGFTIRPEPYKDGDQYQTCGTIEKEVGGVLKRHRFIRADRHASLESAETFTLDKARQIVDLQGERIFD